MNYKETSGTLGKALLTLSGMLLFLAGFMIFIPVLALFPASAVQCQDSEAEILWDNYGVPHIYASGPTEMYYAFGWSQMENHADLILKLYGQARGKASEYWGTEYLETDKLITLFEIPVHAESNYKQQKEPYKSYIDAFVRGLNDYANAHPEAITVKFRQVLPVSGNDIFAHLLRILCLEFLAGEDLYIVRRTVENGSNAYSIAPSRSASGNAMLVTNPHLPWSDFFLWFESHLVCPGFNAYGITLVGIPTLSMAFNDHLGWAFTVNTLDGADCYELLLKDGGYVLDGEIRQFERKIRIIRTIQDDGTLIEVPVECRYSVHGPVTGEKGDKAFALRVTGMENHRILEQYHKMAAATSLSEFEEALKMLQNPMFNILYADRSGNILYLFNGNVPKRSGGDFAFWIGTIDGTKSMYIWNEYLTYNELPKVLNPASGFLQNCNDPPWTCTFPPVLKPEKFPLYIAPQFMHFRAQRAVNMIRKLPSLTFDQLIQCKFNTGMETADRLLDDLLDAVEQFPDSLARKASSILINWDRSTESNSRGAILFATWFDKLTGSMFKIPWSPANPTETPDGLANPELAVRLLAEAADAVQKEYGSLDVEWGSVHRFRLNGKDYPANGGPERYGIFRTIDYMIDADSKKRAVFGDTYVAVTEFGKPVKAMVLLGYGNASQPGNKHIGNQFELLSAKKLRPALLSEKSIMENLEKKEELIVSW
jgi:acyl-homoserine-lactone acylase